MLSIARGRNRNSNFVAGKMGQDLVGSGQRLQLRDDLEKLPVMLLLKVFDIHARFLRHFTQQFLDERFTAHADAAMNLPFCKDNACALESVGPGDDVMVDAIDESAIEIEQDCGKIGASDFVGIVMRCSASGLRAF